MIEWSTQTIWNVVIIGCNALIALALIIVLRKLRSHHRSNTSTGTGTYCGHCGRNLAPDPVRVIALVNANYFVYKCAACQNETLLPSQ